MSTMAEDPRHDGDGGGGGGGNTAGDRVRDRDGNRAERLVRLGQPPRDWRELLRKALWIGIWLVFLNSPFLDLFSGEHSTAGTAGGWLGLTVFVGLYLALVSREMGPRAFPRWLIHGIIAALGALAVLLTLTLGSHWVGLFVYVSVACGLALPLRAAYWAVPGTTALMALVVAYVDLDQLSSMVLLTLLIGFAMTSVSQLVRTTIELRRARATVARLAANEERLRLARDLHDLLGHSLSLITLKSELAGRMLPAHPDKAAQQVADIESVSRQALVDVREAVSGYRRPRLAEELAGAQVALAAAGVTADLPAEPALDGVPEERESALAWALREAVTNVVRHSGARRCAVSLIRRQTLDGPVLELSVEDDGPGGTSGAAGGGSGGGHGNGLTGLTERLQKVGGSLETGRVGRTGQPGRTGRAAGSGYRLVARVPAGVPQEAAGGTDAAGDAVGSGT
ncbi:two-component system sensor kinase [Streptomyces griseoaurantiacus M045]|uniref:Two-component system sensor kinase n=1 Tax=Streptomyces griseoaurantiacus M045 TaxID=996637 RepID=F3NML7_9ACTN|nr:histidine kinase [Streptomyces griseoaurantiacus]EGG45053.1 two-component system sensor kinase [Streptomyces griseoaurantiacus M045]